MDYGRLAKPVLQMLYSESMSIYRHTTITNEEDGTSDNILSSVPLFSDVPCRISFKTLDPPFEQDEGGRDITTAIKLFTDPDIKIKAGDYIVVSRGNEAYSGYAGQPASYSSHLEVSLTHRSMA